LQSVSTMAARWNTIVLRQDSTIRHSLRLAQETEQFNAEQ
jgi:hypothetical protein